MNINNSFNNARQLDQAQTSKQTQLQRISSGHRINSAKDDAAGLAISTRFESQGRAQQAALRNSLDGVSRVQVESGALATVTEDLQRIRELKVQQGSGILNDQDKAALQSEIDSRSDNISQIFSNTEFNQKGVFQEGNLSFQTGVNAGDAIELTTDNLAQSFQEIGLETGTAFNLDQIDDALLVVSNRQSDLGAVENRLIANSEFLALKNENNQAANSRVKDADIAKAVSESVKSDILSQVAIAVQSQANVSSKNALNLLESK